MVTCTAAGSEDPGQAGYWLRWPRPASRARRQRLTGRAGHYPACTPRRVAASEVRKGGAGPSRTYHGGEVCALPTASCYDAFPQLQWDVGDVVGAGDGRAVQGGQVGRLDWRPTSRLQVNHHQLLLGQHHQGIGVIEGCGDRPRVRGCRSHKEAVYPARPGGIRGSGAVARESAFYKQAQGLPWWSSG